MTAEALTVTEATTTDGRTVYSLALPDGKLMVSKHRPDLDWFAALVAEAPYFVTGPTE